MENKKVTAKDVAKEAGVSIATVSYVLNGRTDQKISPETKKKVLQIANLLNYVPSHAAKSLATGSNNTIGIAYESSASLTKDASVMQIVNGLADRLHRMQYDVAFISPTPFENGGKVNRFIDAIIAIDLSNEHFRLLADSFLVPVICVQMLVNDSLFYQIYEDLPFLIKKAAMEFPAEECFFLYDSVHNTEYEQYILALPENILPLRFDELTETKKEMLRSKNLIILGGILTLSLLPYINEKSTVSIVSSEESALLPKGIIKIENNNNKIENLTINVLQNALNRNFDINHDQRVR